MSIIDEFGFVEPRVPYGYDIHAILGQAGVESPHGVTVRVGVPHGDDMAEACPEPVEGKTLRGRLLSTDVITDARI
ncbi:MAG: hypothetical protein Q8L64_00835 [bacterium]|nr:hypothetical protein [bacterium]